MKNNEKSPNEVSKRVKFKVSDFNKFLLSVVIYIISIALFTYFLRFPYIFNTEITYNVILYVSFAPILIFSAGIMFRPWTALFTCVLGSVLGELCYCLVYGCGESLPAYLLFMVASPGLAGMLISKIHQKLKPRLINEIAAMIVGAIWLFIGLLIAAFLYYEVFIAHFYWQLYIVYILAPLLLTIHSFLLIPISVILNLAIKHIFKVQYFDDFLGINQVNNN